LLGREPRVPGVTRRPKAHGQLLAHPDISGRSRAEWVVSANAELQIIAREHNDSGFLITEQEWVLYH
jgi:hypothetical protein